MLALLVLAASLSQQPTPTAWCEESHPEREARCGEPDTQKWCDSTTEGNQASAKNQTENHNAGAASDGWFAVLSSRPTDQWVAILTAILAAIGFVQVLIFWRQVTHQEAVERPWVMIRVEKENVMQKLGLEYPTFPMLLELEWSAINYGPTPAWSLGGSLGFRVVRKPFPRKIPIPHVHREPLLPLPPADKLPEGVRPHQLRLVCNPEFTAQDMIAMAKHEASLMFFGIIRYRDARRGWRRFRRPYYTSFCWEWHYLVRPEPQPVSLFFGPGGPDSWHKAT